ncbi:MAG: fimbria/pilus outer membrane usher protein [Acidobacteriota bacterium]
MLPTRRSSVVHFVVILAMACFGVCSSAVAGDEQRVILPFEVNGVARGEVNAVLRGNDVLVPRSMLEEGGIHGLRGSHPNDADPSYVSLSSMAPELTFVLDQEELILQVTVDPRFLGSRSYDLSTAHPENLSYSKDTSAFLNYAVSTHRFREFSGFGEVGVSLRGRLLFSGVSVDGQGKVSRGLSNVTFDDLPHLRRTVLGDSFVSSDALGGSALLGGLTISRNFNLDPYFVRYPSLAFSGATATPSTAEVYVNGSLVRQEELPPGQFEFQNLALPIGSGSAQVVIRDVFGQERVLSSSYYSSAGVLARGLSEYNYSLGFRRNMLANKSFDYSKPALLAYHRFGLTNDVTIGGRLEASSDLVSGGSSMALRLPIGELDFSAAASSGEQQSGFAGSAAYTYLVRRSLSIGGTLRTLSDHYANLTIAPLDDRPKFDVVAFAGLPFSRGSFSVQAGETEYRDKPGSRNIGVSVSLLAGRQSNVFLSATRRKDSGGSSNDVFAGVSYFFGRNTTANISTQRSAGGTTSKVELQKSLPAGTGYGYRLNTPIGAATPGIAQSVAQYQNRFGRYELSVDPRQAGQSLNVSVAGGIVAIGGGFYATRPVQESFALMRVPGVDGVDVMASNQVIGTTNRKGDFLIPNLLSYYGNRLGIQDQDIPLDHEVDSVEKIVAPPYRGGAIVTFPVRRIQNVQGMVVIIEGKTRVIPSYGEMSIDDAHGKTADSPVGSDGAFYFENLAAGKYRAEVRYDGNKKCSFELDIPASDDSFVILPEQHCDQSSKP